MSVPDLARVMYHEGERMRKLMPRAWVGCFMGCDGDANVRIWKPEKTKVDRVDTANISHGERTDDP